MYASLLYFIVDKIYSSLIHFRLRRKNVVVRREMLEPEPEEFAAPNGMQRYSEISSMYIDISLMIE